MSNISNRLLACITALVLSCCIIGVPVQAQSDYPNQTIKIIAGYPPGGGTDTQARLMAEHLAKYWGQPVVVDNMPGSLGIISARAVANARPDGYTMYMATFDHLILGYSLKKEKAFETQNDFIPISSVADQA